MYCLSDKQIGYILNDISARGVGMESLQQNLLDHVCCIIEQNLEENGDFESFYQKTIQTFYKNDLWEIEEETLTLLTFKNYYTMKKIMIMSGIFSAAILSLGLIFKFNHLPGAALLIPSGILCASLLFLPLLFILKIKEKQKSKEKLILGIGLIPAIAISMSVTFKVMHWPGANMLGMLSVACMLLVFLPFYFFSGIKNPETKINTIVSSVLIIIGCGLFLTLVNTRPHLQENANIHANQYLQDSYENITRQSNSLYEAYVTGHSENKNSLTALNIQCNQLCDKIEQLKLELLNKTEGSNAKAINYEEFGKLENFDIPTRLLFTKEMVASPELTELKKDLDSLDVTVRSGFKINTPVNLLEKTGEKGEATSWATANFYNTPLNYILRNLTQVQINIRCIELDCIAGQGANTLHASK
jgi:gliding motility-associated GldM-like protein